MKNTLILCSLIFLVSCQNPQSAFEEIILETGYIPFRNPMSDTKVGTIIKGNANTLIPSVPSYRCFPESIGDYQTELVHVNQTDLPEKYKEFIVEFGANISALSENGNPTFEFNSNFKRAKTISVKFEGAQIETLDEFQFESFYTDTLLDACKKALAKSSFIVGALKVEKMNFTFKDEFGANIALDVNNIDEIVKFHAGVSFSIKNNYTLVIETPKYIGYRLAKLSPNNDGLIQSYSWSFEKNGEFIFKSLRKFLGRF